MVAATVRSLAHMRSLRKYEIVDAGPDVEAKVEMVTLSHKKQSQHCRLLTTPHYITSHYTTPHYTTPHHITPHHTTPYYPLVTYPIWLCGLIVMHPCKLIETRA